METHTQRERQRERESSLCWITPLMAHVQAWGRPNQETGSSSESTIWGAGIQNLHHLPLFFPRCLAGRSEEEQPGHKVAPVWKWRSTAGRSSPPAVPQADPLTLVGDPANMLDSFGGSQAPLFNSSNLRDLIWYSSVRFWKKKKKTSWEILMHLLIKNYRNRKRYLICLVYTLDTHAPGTKSVPYFGKSSWEESPAWSSPCVVITFHHSRLCFPYLLHTTLCSCNMWT